jgi:hypothetical protein
MNSNCEANFEQILKCVWQPRRIDSRQREYGRRNVDAALAHPRSATARIERRQWCARKVPHKRVESRLVELLI